MGPLIQLKRNRLHRWLAVNHIHCRLHIWLRFLSLFSRHLKFFNSRLMLVVLLKKAGDEGPNLTLSLSYSIVCGHMDQPVRIYVLVNQCLVDHVQLINLLRYLLHLFISQHALARALDVVTNSANVLLQSFVLDVHSDVLLLHLLVVLLDFSLDVTVFVSFSVLS